MTFFYALITIAIVVFFLNKKTSFFNLLILNLFLLHVGTFILLSRNETTLKSSLQALGATFFLIIGYVIGNRTRLKHAQNIIAPEPANRGLRSFTFSDVTVYAIVISVMVFSAFHLIVGGVPVLSPRVETARFDFNSSGFFGIPGRVFLYGPTLAWVVSGVNSSVKQLRVWDYGPFKLATVTLLVCSITSGFKGDLLTAAVLFLGFGAKYGSQNTFNFLSVTRKYFWLLAVPFLYFYLIGTRYRSYSLNETPLYIDLFNRFTVQGAEPGNFVLNMNKEIYASNFSLLDDFQVLISKYLGIAFTDRITFEKFVSIKLLGWDNFTTSYFTPPQTIGIFPEIDFFFGLVPAIISMTFIGFIFNRFENHKSNNALFETGSVLGISLLSALVIKGALAYHVINILILYTLALLLISSVDALFRKT